MADLVLEIIVTQGGLAATAVKLSDSAAGFGVRRKDTQVVLVADATAMVVDPTNSLRWTYTATGAVEGVTYEWVAEIEYSGSFDYFEFEHTVATVVADAVVTDAKGGMTTLQAINKILKGMGEPRVTAVDTGGSSLAANAERELDDVNQEIQNTGFFAGTTDAYEMEFANKSIVVSGGSGTFIYDETVTESTSGATAKFKHIGASMFLVPISGDLTGDETLTGGTSGATRTGAALTTLTTGFHYCSDVWVKVARNDSEPLRIAKRGIFLYDETNQTALFSVSVLLDVTRWLYFRDLPYGLANYVACKAALDMLERYERGSPNLDRLEKKMMQARANAIVEDEDMRQTNIFNTPHARKIRGHRVYNEASHRIIG